MMKAFIILLASVVGYKVGETSLFTSPEMIFQFCEGIQNTFKTTVLNAIEKLPLNMVQRKSPNRICNVDSSFYARTLTMRRGAEVWTEIQLSDRLLNYPNTMNNVILHELLHSMGLKHSEKPGIMNYSVLTQRDLILEDRRVLWLSEDDIMGLYYLLHH